MNVASTPGAATPGAIYERLWERELNSMMYSHVATFLLKCLHFFKGTSYVRYLRFKGCCNSLKMSLT